jgi:hypothetical protein
MACMPTVGARINLKRLKIRKFTFQNCAFSRVQRRHLNTSLSPSCAQAGMPVHTLTTPSLADGLTVPTVGINAFATGAPLIDKVMRQYFLCLVLCVHPLPSVVS